MAGKYYRVDDVMAILECSASYAYKIIGRINEELDAQGYITIRGKVPKRYFEKKLCLEMEKGERM